MSFSSNNSLDQLGRSVPARWQSVIEEADIVRGFDENVSPALATSKRNSPAIYEQPHGNNNYCDTWGRPASVDTRTTHLTQSDAEIASAEKDSPIPALLSLWRSRKSNCGEIPYFVDDNEVNRSGLTARNFRSAVQTVRSIWPTSSTLSDYTDLENSDDWAASGDFELYGVPAADCAIDEYMQDIRSDLSFDTVASSFSSCERPTPNAPSTSSTIVEHNTSASSNDFDLSSAPPDTPRIDYEITRDPTQTADENKPPLTKIPARHLQTYGMTPRCSPWDGAIDPKLIETAITPWTCQEKDPRTMESSCKVNKPDDSEGDLDKACDMRSTISVEQDSDCQYEDEEILKSQQKIQILAELEVWGIQRFARFRKNALEDTDRVRMLRKRLRQCVRGCLGIPLKYALCEPSHRILLSQVGTRGPSEGTLQPREAQGDFCGLRETPDTLCSDEAAPDTIRSTRVGGGCYMPVTHGPFLYDEGMNIPAGTQGQRCAESFSISSCWRSKKSSLVLAEKRESLKREIRIDRRRSFRGVSPFHEPGGTGRVEAEGLRRFRYIKRGPVRQSPLSCHPVHVQTAGGHKTEEQCSTTRIYYLERATKRLQEDKSSFDVHFEEAFEGYWRSSII